MANIESFNVINAGDFVFASVVSENFTRIAAAINSNNLNSENYGVSSVRSQNIQTAAIGVGHIQQNAVVAFHISAGAVLHEKVQFASNADGVRILQIGAASSDMPANGVIGGRYTNTLAVAASTASHNIAFSDALDGAPGFTGDPQFGVVGFQVAAASDEAPFSNVFTALDSVSVDISYQWTAGVTQTMTVHAFAEGPK